MDGGVAGGDTTVKARPFGRFAALTAVSPPADGESMNDPEVTMPNAHEPNQLIAHAKALEAAAIVIRLAMRLPAPLRSLADQLIRSASSVPANVAEGHGRFGRDRLNHWRIAYGSAKEVDSHLRLLVASGVLDPEKATTALDLFDEVRAMIWVLLHPMR